MVTAQKKGQTTCPNWGIWELDVTSALKAFHFKMHRFAMFMLGIRVVEPYRINKSFEYASGHVLV